MCDGGGIGFGVAREGFNRGNGAMIAYAGGLLYRRYGSMPIEKRVPVTNYRFEKMKEILG